VKYFYNENHKTLMEETEETIEDGESFHEHDRQNRYYENGLVTPVNVQIQRNPHQNPDDILCRTREAVI
jgi:hypothetical protein